MYCAPRGRIQYVRHVAHFVATEHMLLRPVREDDLPAVFAVHNDPATSRYDPSGLDADVDASRRRLDTWLLDWERDGIGYWAAIALRHEDQAEGQPATAPIGFVGVRHADASEWSESPEPLLNLCYRFSPHCWGRSLATEAGRSSVAWSARHRPERPVVAITTPDNGPSIAVARKLGFSRYRAVVYHGAPSVEYRLSSERPAGEGASVPP
jgi:RimJ/RimL family protein N-acetyltransferase